MFKWQLRFAREYARYLILIAFAGCAHVTPTNGPCTYDSGHNGTECVCECTTDTDCEIKCGEEY
jgi:hypothetical protein